MSTSIPVPKFTSFRPKPVEEGKAKTANSVEDSGRGSPERKERKHHHHHHRRHRSRSKERTQKQVLEERLPIQIVSDDTNDLFVEDRRGDIQNLVYGSIHRYSVPAFHRIGAGSVLGANPGHKIERNSAEDKGIILIDRRNDRKGEREKYAFARNEKKAPRLLRIRPDLAEDAAAAENLDFIAFQNPRLRKRQRIGSDASSSSEEDRKHYRSIEGKAKGVNESIEEGLEWTSDSDSSDPETGRTIKFDEALRKENINLSRRVDENPGDVDAWIALIDHQDSLLGLSDGGHRKITIAERRSTADIKLHMYEKALAKAGTTLVNRERLLLGLMAEGAKIWDFKTQSERWEQVSQENLDSVLLWKQYLDFRQSNFVTFRYEEVRDIFLRRIKLLREAIVKGEKSKTGEFILVEHLIYTILRATLFIRESGYSELAIGIWQALLELNYFGPKSEVPRGSRLDNFREFWDSEVLRIGEEGAKGWKNFDPDTEALDPRFDDEVPQKYLETDDVFDGWVAAEKVRAAASSMPARTLDETVEDDPYRVILWSDIEDFLLDFSSSSTSVDSSCLLLDAFLIFCRLPPVSFLGSQTSRQWWIDSFVRGELVECSLNWMDNHLLYRRAENAFTTPALLTNEAEGERGPNPFVWPFPCFASSCDTLFPPQYWARYFMPWRDPFANQGPENTQNAEKHLELNPFNVPAGLEAPVPYEWVRNILKSIAQLFRDGTFMDYYLAFEFCYEPQDIKKIAKSLLKQNPQSLRLYNAYAMIEWSRGNREISTNVITAALGMRTSLPEVEQRESILLWKTWAWAYIDDGENSAALKCLFSIADGTPLTMKNPDLSSPAVLLKARQHLSSNRDFSVSSGDNYHAVIYAECLALLEYLSSQSGNETTSQKQGDIDGALAVFDNFSKVLITRGGGPDIFQELLLQSMARLLYHHARSGPFRPALLRDHLTKSLKLFPRNTIFLSFFSWNEFRLRIDDRVRGILRSVVLTEANDNIVSRLFAIRYEMHAGNVHSTLAAFENAVSSPFCKSNPGLWRYYVLFCVNSKELRRKAREVFFRGMRACPWAKEFIMTAFTEVGGLGTEDKVAIYRVLMEKELRVHVDVEHRIEELRGQEDMALDTRP